MTKLNKKEIIDLLPHREPMLLIDELKDIVKLKSATALMYVKKDSFYVNGHFPGNPNQKKVFAELIKGQASWSVDEVEEQVAKMARLLGEQLQYSRTTAELLNELKD